MNGRNENITYQYLFRAISHELKLMGDEKLEAFNLTNYQARILGFIANNEEEGVSQVDLEKATNRKGPSITNMVKILEKNGFVSRKVDPKDERRKLIYLLPKSREILGEFNGLFFDIENQITSGMNLEEKEKLFDSLKAVLNNLEKRE